MAAPASSAADGDSRSRDSVQVVPGLADKTVGDTAAADIAAVAADTAILGTVAAGKVIARIEAGPRCTVALRTEDTGLGNNLSHFRVLPSTVSSWLGVRFVLVSED